MKIKESQLRKIIRESLEEYVSMTENDALDAKIERAKEALGADKLCDELFRVMGQKEVEEKLLYIDRMYRIGLFDQDDEHEEELNEERINPEDYMDDDDDDYNPRHQKRDKVEPRKMRKDKVN